jgi:hypothetical protein
MKKMLFSLAAVVALSTGAANAADLRMPVKAPPPVIVTPWDIAFGSAITSDYVFRGITQSNHKPSVSAYFEPRYNISANFQLYAGLGGASISFPNRAAAEIDIYGGARATFGALALDVGGWYYWYPGGQCFNAAIAGECALNGNLPLNGNVIKKDLSFFEVYGKANYTFNDMFAVGANAYYTPSFLNSGADGVYASLTAKFTGPAMSSGLGWYVSGELGRQWLGTSDSFYGVNTILGNFSAGIPFADYTTWNVGVGLTYKVFTLDLRYSGTDLSKGECNAFTGDHTATTAVTPTGINPGGIGSKWCGDVFMAKLSVDTSLAAIK